jgi:hypothetical protein
MARTDWWFRRGLRPWIRGCLDVIFSDEDQVHELGFKDVWARMDNEGWGYWDYDGAFPSRVGQFGERSYDDSYFSQKSTFND